MSWEMRSIGEVCNVIPGFAFKSKDLGETGIPVVKIGNITDDYRVDIDSVQHLPENLFKEMHEKFMLANDDIVIAMTGATAGKIGRIRCPKEQVFLLNQRVAKFKPRNINPDFFWSAISTLRYRTIFYRLGGGVAQPNMSSAQIEEVKIPYPPPTVQDRIASILSAYDDLIENNRRRIVLLERAARELYRGWFVRLRFPGHEHTKIIDGVPEGWTQGIIADLGNLVTGKTPSKKRESYYGNDVPFIKTPDMHGNTVIVETEECLSDEGANSQANKMLPSRSILVSCIGTVGAVALNEDHAQTNQQINTIIPREDWLRYWTFFMAKTLKPLLEGMGGGATMTNVNKSKFSAIPVVVPSQLILEQYNAVVAPNIDQIERLAAMNGLLTSARDLLLPRLMSREVAV